ncbi:VirB4 family type IV secretion system protein [Eubacterium aggregans]|uniref:VirB4 family type IV secretion system protein n=1 Tax=Eubacterium aggregans TaxID=81409 RepID=UPI003F34AADE
MGLLKKKKELPLDIHGRIIEEKEGSGKVKSPDLINAQLVNMITTMGLEFKRNEFIVGENLGRVYGVTQYPKRSDHSWLSKPMNIHGTVAAIKFQPVDNSSFLDSLNRTIHTCQMVVNDTRKDPLSRQRAQSSIDDAERTMAEIDQNGETVGTVSLTLMPLTTTRKKFDSLCKKVVNTFKIAKCQIKLLPNLQKEGFQAIFPSYTESPDVEQKTEQVMQISTFIGEMPFSSSGFNDRSGYFLGRDGSGGIVIIDPWIRGGFRGNSNWVIMGDSGMGKSFTIKNMALMEWALGTQIIFIDPEGEYRELTESVGGEWINASGGGGKVFNPLQIIRQPSEEDDDCGTSDLQPHLRTVETFLRLYLKQITDIQLAAVKKELIELYEHFGITWEMDITQFKNAEFPIFKDLLDQIIKKEELFKTEGNRRKVEEYSDIASLLRDVAIGGDSFLWRQHSTLDSAADMVCIDTSGLNSSPDNIKAAQYFNLQNWAWQKMSADRQQQVIVVYDEVHMVIDKDVPQPMKNLSQQERRVRKYEAAVWVASQQGNDFVDPNIKNHGQAILDQPTYKLILGMNGQGLADIAALYNLKEAEKELLESKQQGRALFIVGSRMIDLDIIVPEYKKKYFGTKSGR